MPLPLSLPLHSTPLHSTPLILYPAMLWRYVPPCDWPALRGTSILVIVSNQDIFSSILLRPSRACLVVLLVWQSPPYLIMWWHLREGGRYVGGSLGRYLLSLSLRTSLPLSLRTSSGPDSVCQKLPRGNSVGMYSEIALSRPSSAVLLVAVRPKGTASFEVVLLKYPSSRYYSC